MSEQEPGAVEQWLDLAEEAETSIDDRYSVDGYALLAFARAHDAEDVRRAAEFAAMHAEAARLAGRLIEREEYIDEREALLERLVAALNKIDAAVRPDAERELPGTRIALANDVIAILDDLGYDELDAALAAVRAALEGP
mgnify:CR=1 FL=1